MRKILLVLALFAGLVNSGFAADGSAAEGSSGDKAYIPWTWDDIED